MLGRDRVGQALGDEIADRRHVHLVDGEHIFLSSEEIANHAGIVALDVVEQHGPLGLLKENAGQFQISINLVLDL